MERSTVGALLRSTQAYCAQLCEKQTLDHGIAYYSEPFASVVAANQFREVVIDNAADIPRAFDEAESWFAERGLACHRWAPAQDTKIEPLEAFLSERGFRPAHLRAMRLARWVDLSVTCDARILPARAMRAAFRDLLEEEGSSRNPADQGAWVQSCERRLDDPQFDVFVAVENGRAVGRCALYQVGDIARVMDWHSSDQGVGVDRAMMRHVLALARRLAMRWICLQIPENDARRHEFFREVGFEDDGAIIEFQRDPA